MIMEMFKDIKVFLLIFFIGVFAFANTYYVLDSGDAEPVAGSSYVTAVIYSYLQSLGEFGIDGYDDKPLSTLYWCLFLISTVFL